MAPLSPNELFDRLVALELRSRRHAAELPQQQEGHEQWSGICFRVGEYRLVAPLSQVLEILNYPRLTRVPGAKNWVKGVANVRGTLLPIMDLRGFLGEQLIRLHRRSRVMVVGHQALAAGLLVDEVIGLRHFDIETRMTPSEPPAEAMAPFIQGCFRHDGVEWSVFSMHRLTGYPGFVQVAA